MRNWGWGMGDGWKTPFLKNQRGMGAGGWGMANEGWGMGDGNGEWGWEVADSNLKKKKSVIPCKNPFSSANPQHPSPADF